MGHRTELAKAATNKRVTAATFFSEPEAVNRKPIKMFGNKVQTENTVARTGMVKDSSRPDFFSCLLLNLGHLIFDLATSSCIFGESFTFLFVNDVSCITAPTVFLILVDFGGFLKNLMLHNFSFKLT